MAEASLLLGSAGIHYRTNDVCLAGRIIGEDDPGNTQVCTVEATSPGALGTIAVSRHDGVDNGTKTENGRWHWATDHQPIIE